MAASVEECIYPGYEKLLFDFSFSNPIYATTAGAIGAFSLALVVIGLEQQADEKGYAEGRSAGLALFMVAFFSLLVATFLYAESSGYTRCGLLVHSSLVAALPFALGAFATFAALLWFVQGRGELLEGTARGLVAAVGLVGTSGVASGNATLFLLHFGDQGSATVVVWLVLSISGFAYFLMTLYSAERRRSVRPKWLTIGCAASTLGAVVWYTVMSQGVLGYAIDDDLTTRVGPSVGAEIGLRTMVWVAALVVAAHSLPVRHAGVAIGAAPPDLVTTVPNSGRNTLGVDPWDHDAVEWLVGQTGGQRWERNDLLDCLTRQPGRLARQPGLVASAERFATSHGVRMEVEPHGAGEVYHLYRTDAGAPAYPHSQGERLTILKLDEADRAEREADDPGPPVS